MKTNNRLVLPLIVILLIISLPFTAVGLGNKIYLTIRGDNPEHLHKIDNKLYYYLNNRLIGTYECQNSQCDSAFETIDDSNDFSYYKSDSNEPMGVFGDGYVFIQDGNELVLYSLKNKIKIGTFKSFKNYGINIAESYIIIQNEDCKYGLFDTESVMYKLQNNYSYIGVSKEMISKLPEDIRLIVKDDVGNYTIINIEGDPLSSNINGNINNYDDNFIYTVKDDFYHIYNYSGEEVLKSIKITKYELYNETLIITNKDGDILIYNYDLNLDSIKTFKNNNKNITYSIEDENLVIKDDADNIIERYSLNDEKPVDTNDEPIPDETNDIVDTDEE